MENISFVRNIYTYMNNVLDEKNTKKLNSLGLTRCFCFSVKETISHDKIYPPPPPPRCFCFQCRLKRLLKETIVKRNDQKFLFFISVNNYNDDDELYYLKRFY